MGRGRIPWLVVASRCSSAWRWMWIALSILAWDIRVAAAEGEAKSAEKRVLVDLRSVLHLSRKEADLAFPVRVQGIVTCMDPRLSLFFVQDDTAGIYIYDTKDSKLRPGAWVEVEGVSAFGRFTPIIVNPVFRVLGNKPLPPPVPVSIDQVINGSQDGQWVAVTGVVRSVSTNYGNAVLELSAGGRKVNARVLDLGGMPRDGLVDSVARVRGVAGGVYAEGGNLAGFQLYSSGADHITILQPPIADPFSLPLRKISEIGPFEPPGTSGRRVKVRGIVTLTLLSRGAYLMDSSGGVFVHVQDASRFKPGDEVDATGFPESGQGGPQLWNALLKGTGAVARPPTPEDVTFPEVFSAKFDKRLVRLRATFIKSEPREKSGDIFLFQSGTGWFQALASSLLTGKALAGLKPGTTAWVSGVCLLRFNPDKQTEAVSLLLRDGRDLEVLSIPSWWTPGPLALLLGMLVICVVAALIAIVFRLRRLVSTANTLRGRERGFELGYHELHEDANDIAFQLDLDGKIVDLNVAGEKVLRLSRAQAIGINLLDYVVPEHRQRARDHLLPKHNEDATHVGQELDFAASNGQRLTLVVSSRVSIRNGKPVGVQGIAHDITQRKRTERELRNQGEKLRALLAARERLGRDLHDGIIQSIYAVGLALEDCKRTVSRTSNEAGDKIAKCVEDLNHVIREVRGFIAGLGSDSLSGAELGTALKSLVLTMNESGGCSFVLQADPVVAESLTARQATQLLYLAREAMSNSLRHGRALSTWVTLEAKGDDHVLEIRDDGQGFDPANLPRAGRGLVNMESRALELGAQFSIESAPGKGTVVTVRIPGRSSEEEAGDGTTRSAA